MGRSLRHLTGVLNHDFCPWANRYVYWLKQPIGWFVLAAAGGPCDRRQRRAPCARNFCSDFGGDCPGSCVAVDRRAGHRLRAFVRPKAGERGIVGAGPHYRDQSLAVAPLGFDGGTRLLSFPRGFSGTDSGRVFGANPGLVSNDLYLGLRAATAGALSHRGPTNRERISLWNLAGTPPDHGRERVVGMAPHGIVAVCPADSWPLAGRRRNSEPARRIRRRHVGTALVPEWRFAAACPLGSNRQARSPGCLRATNDRPSKSAAHPRWSQGGPPGLRGREFVGRDDPRGRFDRPTVSCAQCQCGRPFGTSDCRRHAGLSRS